MDVIFCFNWHGQLIMECNHQTRQIKKSDKSYPAVLKFISSRIWRYENIHAGHENEFDTYFEQVFSANNDNGGSAYLLALLEAL